MMFFEQLKLRIQETKTRLCLGIDPQIPADSHFLKANHAEIDAVDQIVSVLVSQAIELDLPAVKFQSAYFEALGIEGLQILQRAILRLKKTPILSILDAKRGDISSTMSAYGKGAFDIMQADCLTINPYMGIDTIEPLLPWLKAGKGVYVVWLTSNKSADTLQMRASDKSLPFASHVYSVFKQFSRTHDVNEAVGYVLGATKFSHEPVKQLLAGIASEAFLLPGVGAQGAVIDSEMLKFLSRHSSSLVPVSREIGGFKVDIKSIEEYSVSVRIAMARLKTELSLPA